LVSPAAADFAQRVSGLADAGTQRSAPRCPQLPFSDGVKARRFPVANITIIILALVGNWRRRI
jgi:hypothetical protein